MADLRAELTRIYEKNNELTPDQVVAEATPERHPLHGRFEWNDAVAGHEYRKVQAAELIRSVKLVYRETPAGEPVKVRAFVSASSDAGSKQQAYHPTEKVLQDDFARKLLLQNCQREIDALTRKYGHLAEFAEMMRVAVA